MRKTKIFVCFIVMLTMFLPVFNAPKVEAASAPVVYWDGMILKKGQIGRLDILKPINLWKRDSGDKLVFVRVLKPGERYRVYQYSSKYGGQYGLGGSCFVTNMKGYVAFKTPSKAKLQQLDPDTYATKLSLGQVTKEDSTVIAPGVTQSKLSVESGTKKQEIHVLNVDQQASQIKFETSLANDQVIGFETVKNTANRNQADEHYVIGGVNGDYFNGSGSPTDLTVINGELVLTNTTPASERTIFGVSKDGRAMIGNPDISLSVSVNGQAAYPINSVNKRRDANHLVLYTPYFSSTTRTNELGTEVVLSNIEGQLNGNNTIKAVVKEVITGKGSASLNKGELVLSGHGLGSNYLQTLAAGDSVEINLTYNQPAWDKVDQAIGGRYHIVKNGAAQSFADKNAHPRTAIGIRKDGSVFVIVVDGRQETGYGVTLNEIASVMKDMGAVEAMTFDGGGSSTMVVREPGNSEVTVINSPSDGSERRVANSLLIVGTWKAGPLASLQLSPGSLKLFAGETYKNLNIAVKGMDKNYNPITVSNKVTWSSTIGTFNADGSFTVGKKAGKGTITAAAASVKASIPVEVIVKPDSILLEDFEGSLSSWKASGAQYNSVKVSAEKNYVKTGKQSLKVAYDFIGKKGTSGVYAIPGSALEIPYMPTKIGMWVYGDAKGHWLRAQLKDAKNETVQLDFTKNLNWTGWKYVEAAVPSGLTAPLKLDMPVRYMEVDDNAKNKGQIFIDQITAVYK